MWAFFFFFFLCFNIVDMHKIDIFFLILKSTVIS